MIWIAWVINNVYWLYWLDRDNEYWFDIVFIDAMFIYRCVICALRWAYLPKTFLQKYIYKLPGKVNKGWGHTLLINGWVKYTLYILHTYDQFV